MTFFGPLSHIVPVSSQRTHFRRVGDLLVVLHFDVHRGRWAHFMKSSELFEIAQLLFLYITKPVRSPQTFCVGVHSQSDSILFSLCAGAKTKFVKRVTDDEFSGSLSIFDQPSFDVTLES